MAKKSVLVILRRSPLHSTKGCEAMRMAVGLHLGENEVTVVLLDAAVWLATPLRPGMVGADDVRKHFEMTVALGGRVVAEQESLRAHGLDESSLIETVRVLPGAAVARLMADSAATFCF